VVEEEITMAVEVEVAVVEVAVLEELEVFLV
jgi:hypothetical protein